MPQQVVAVASSLDAPLTDQEGAALFADVLGEDDQAVGHAIDMDSVHAHLDELPEREQRALAYLRDKLTSDPEENTMRPPGLGAGLSSI
jgi:hypothetical protein